MNPHEYKNIHDIHDSSFRALIGNASRSYNDIKSCREAKAVIVVDIWLSSLCSFLSCAPTKCNIPEHLRTTNFPLRLNTSLNFSLTNSFTKFVCNLFAYFLCNGNKYYAFHTYGSYMISLFPPLQWHSQRANRSSEKIAIM